MGHVWCAAHSCTPWHRAFRSCDSLDAWNHLKQSFLKHYPILGSVCSILSTPGWLAPQTLDML
jgi:hypothetical protein